MVLPASVGLLAALYTWTLKPLVVGIIVDVLAMLVLRYAIKSFFQGVEIDVKQVEAHMSLYNPLSKGGAEGDEPFKERRLRNYKEVALNYYNLTTQIFHKIWGPHYSMAIQFPVEDRSGWQSYPQAQSVYQCFLALSLRASEDSVIGDFGCGTGGPTRCIAQFSGARIKAVNINPAHLRQMELWNRQAGLSHRIEPVCADYHATGLPAASLDGVYMCESAACTFDHAALCREVFRVLRPGGRFTGFDWQMTDRFDERDPEHRRVRFLLELGVGVPRLVPMSYMRRALREAGFRVVAVRNHSDWAARLGGKPWDALFDAFRAKFWVTSAVRSAFRLAAAAGCLHPAYVDAVDMMVACREGMVRGGPGELDIFTPMAYWLAIKPEE